MHTAGYSTCRLHRCFIYYVHVLRICAHNRLLRAKGVNGTYLIRAGSRAGSEKVLSVWHEDRCRHYKLFKDEVLYYYGTHLLKTLPTLLLAWRYDTRANSMHLLPTSERKYLVECDLRTIHYVVLAHAHCQETSAFRRLVSPTNYAYHCRESQLGIGGM